MDRQQELYTYLLVTLRGEGYTVYDTGPPGKKTRYPYILLGDIQQVDYPTKSRYMSDVYPTIHVYHNNPLRRGELSDILLRIKELCYEYTDRTGWMLKSCSTSIRPDNTTTIPMLHGIVEPNFSF